MEPLKHIRSSSEAFEVHSFQVLSYSKLATPVTSVQLDSPFMF